MTQQYRPHLQWIDQQADRMRDWVHHWSEINTGTHNLQGLKQLTPHIVQAFEALGAQTRLIDVDPASSIDSAGNPHRSTLAPAINATQRPEAPQRVFLGIHIDTVYPPDHPFQNPQQIDTNTLRGPGVADAKGGLAVMLIALEALERSGLANGIGWEALINTDEEIGSPGSAPLLALCAKRNHIGLVFEPTLPDGTLIGARGGSGNYTAVIRGQAAHVGRQFHLGRSAIDTMAQMIAALSALNTTIPGATVNVGRVEGGGPLNVVPDLAICRFNVRVQDQKPIQAIETSLKQIVNQAQQRDGIRVELHGGWTSPPKPLDQPLRTLLNHIAACGQELDTPIQWESSGGVCDGNKLAAAGLPTVDTLGPQGGNIHSPDEYLLLHSLTQRAKLTALLLMKLATAQLDWPNTRP